MQLSISNDVWAIGLAGKSFAIYQSCGFKINFLQQSVAPPTTVFRNMVSNSNGLYMTSYFLGAESASSLKFRDHYQYYERDSMEVRLKA